MRTWQKVVIGGSAVLLVVAAVKEGRTPSDLRTGRGRVLGVPYDLRLPTPGRVAASLWAPDDPRLVIERGPWGLGWSVNLARLAPARLRSHHGQPGGRRARR